MKILVLPVVALALWSTALAEVDTNALPKVEDGFEIGFFVKEPHIINPSALCFDKRGRLYVGAGPQYRNPREDSPTDYIKILIDGDGDGVAETVKTFAEGLNSVQSMAWKGNELWVANSPELTVLRDTDGDDVADEYQVIYTGLNNLRHGLHGLNWGPDGWLYMTIGNTWVKTHAPRPFRDLQGLKSDDQTEYPLTEVYTRETYPKSYHPMRKDEKEGGIFRCRPGGHDLELFARGMRNPWDMCMDGGFNWLATDNDPGPPADRIFMPIRHGHYGMKHPWKFDWKGTHPAVAPVADLFPGTSGSGTGVVYYHSTHFPEAYRNRHLIADWTNNCIFLYTPTWDGAHQVPAEEKRKIVESSGGYGDLKWKGGKGRSLFRPTDMEIGPDGAVYIAGWGSVYGTDYVPREKWTAEENAKYQGRVFRLRHEDPLVPRNIWDTDKRSKNLEAWTPAELLEDLGSPLPVWRVHAQDELIRRGPAVRDDLLKAVLAGNLGEMQATWAIWAVGRIGLANGTAPAELMELARSGSDLNLRIQATRILGEGRHSSATPLLVGLLSDSEPRVRHAAMQSLDLIGWGDHREAILAAVANETDRVARYTAWQVLRRQVPAEDRRALLDDKRFMVRQLAALSLMQDGDRDLQRRADEYLNDSGAPPGNSPSREDLPPSTTVVLTADERSFRDTATISFTTLSTGYVGPVEGKPVAGAASLRVDLGRGDDNSLQAAWQEWAVAADGGLIKETRSFPFSGGSQGTITATLSSITGGVSRHYGLDHVRDAATLALPAVWSDQVFFNNNTRGAMTLHLEGLAAGTYRFTSYSYADNLSAGSNDEGTVKVSVNGRTTPVRVSMISGKQSSLADGAVEAADLHHFGTADFLVSVGQSGDPLHIRYGDLTAGDTFGLNGFELSRVSDTPTPAGAFDIRYTLDGSEPGADSPVADGRLEVTNSATLHAAAFDGKTRISEVASLPLHRITDSEWKDRLFVQDLNREGYEVIDDGLQRGVRAYADDPAATITEVPNAIAGVTLIRTRRSDQAETASDFLRFHVNLPAGVLVAYDASDTPPDWLAGWEKTSHTVTTSSGSRFLVYGREFPAGPVTLGANAGAATMYQVYLRKAGAGKTTTAAVKPLLAGADPKRGEEIFFGRGTCFACHQVKGKGVVIGPELVGIHQRRDADYVIDSIVNPDAYIVEGFQQTSLEMTDGRTLFGMIQEETAQAIKLTLPNGEQLEVRTEDVKKRDDAKHSGMPSSFAYTLSAQDVADMTAWIMDLK